MKVHELVDMLSKIPQDAHIYIDVKDGGVGGVRIEEVTESCDDPTIIGYIITDRGVE